MLLVMIASVLYIVVTRAQTSEVTMKSVSVAQESGRNILTGCNCPKIRAVVFTFCFENLKSGGEQKESIS